MWGREYVCEFIIISLFFVELQQNRTKANNNNDDDDVTWIRDIWWLHGQKLKYGLHNLIDIEMLANAGNKENFHLNTML